MPVPCTKQRDAQLVEERLHPLADFLHQLVIGEQHERFAVRLLDEMLDPMDQRVGVAVLARVGHFLDGEQLHLPLVIERRADLQHAWRLSQPTRLAK